MKEKRLEIVPFFLFIMVPWINGINEYLGIKLKYRKHINVLHDDFFVIQRRECKIVKYKKNHVSSKAIAHSKSEGFMAKYTTSKLVNHLSLCILS